MLLVEQSIAKIVATLAIWHSSPEEQSRLIVAALDTEPLHYLACESLATTINAIELGIPLIAQREGCGGSQLQR